MQQLFRLLVLVIFNPLWCSSQSITARIVTGGGCSMCANLPPYLEDWLVEKEYEFFVELFWETQPKLAPKLVVYVDDEVKEEVPLEGVVENKEQLEDFLIQHGVQRKSPEEIEAVHAERRRIQEISERISRMLAEQAKTREKAQERATPSNDEL